MGIIFWTCPPNTAPGEKLRVDIFPSTIPSLQHELRGIPAARLCSCKGCPRLVQFSPRESGLFLRQEGSRTQSVRGLTPAHQPTATARRGKAPQAEGHWGTCGMRREQKQGCIHAPSPTPFQESIPVLSLVVLICFSLMYGILYAIKNSIYKYYLPCICYKYFLSV